MLKEAVHNSRQFVAPAIFLVVLFVTAGPTLSPSYDDCRQEQQNSYSDDEQNSEAQKIRTFVYCDGVFAEANNGAITATATVFLTLITGTLAWLAREQAKTTKAQLRPYVMIKSARVDGLEIGKQPKATITLKNFGATPALEMTQWSNMGGDAFPPTHNFPMEERKEDTKAVSPLAPGGEFIATPFNPKFPPFSEEYMAALRKGEAAIYVIGRIKYRDSFGGDHVTEYVLFAGGPIGVDGALSPYKTGNRIT